MITIIKNPVKLLLLFFGLFYLQDSLAYKNNLIRPIDGIEGEQKVGRNDDCPCGSGKKYKKCHGKNN
jgi:hypothetical protein